MENRAQRATGGRGGELWSRLDAFLHTDPRDAGCEAAMELLDVYAELLVGGSDPGERFPGLHAHFVACGTCAEDLQGLLASLTGDTGSGSQLE